MVSNQLKEQSYHGGDGEDRNLLLDVKCDMSLFDIKEDKLYTQIEKEKFFFYTQI